MRFLLRSFCLALAAYCPATAAASKQQASTDLATQGQVERLRTAHVKLTTDIHTVVSV